MYALPLEAKPSYPGQSLPRCRRIRQRTEFEQAFLTPGISNKWFTIHVRKNDSGKARLGVIASKRYLPTAVARNFAKRLMREVFRRNFPAASALDVVIKTRRHFQPAMAVEGRTALVQLLHTVQM